MSTTIIELENKDIVVKMSGRGPIGPRGLQGEPGPAGPSEWGAIQGNISDQTDLQAVLDAKADVGASYTKSEEDALLAQKADADSVYTKTETDSLLSDKADADDVYSKTEVTTLLSGKADSDTVYTKTETDTLLDAKADVGDSYTKAEEDALLAVKANSADVYTKTETDTLLADKADADDVYTKTAVDTALALKANSADVYTKTATDALLLDKAPVILSSASGSIASFSDGSASPVTALSVSIEPVQSGTGDPSPDNVRPISGHTSAVVTRTGKNLLDDSAFSTSAWNKYGVPNFLKPNTTYRFLVSGSTSYTYRLYMTSSSGAGGTDVGLNSNYQSSGNGQPFTTPADMSSYPYLKIGGSGSGAGLDMNAKFQITLGSTATAYEAPQIQTVTIDLDGTRYGGMLNVLTGELTVTWASITLDENTKYTGFTKSTEYGSWADVDGIRTKNSSTTISVISDRMPGVSYEDRVTNPLVDRTYGHSARITVRVSANRTDIDTAQKLKNYFVGAQLVYLLETPLTISLTPQQINSLLGENHIWADTGDVAVEYRADSKMYIDQSLQSQSNALKLMLTPNVETEMVASQNYTSGSIVIVNNDFIKLTSAVASGANLVIGSNCVKTTMAEWVASLTA